MPYYFVNGHITVQLQEVLQQEVKDLASVYCEGKETVLVHPGDPEGNSWQETEKWDRPSPQDSTQAWRPKAAGFGLHSTATTTHSRTCPETRLTGGMLDPKALKRTELKVNSWSDFNTLGLCNPW